MFSKKLIQAVDAVQGSRPVLTEELFQEVVRRIEQQTGYIFGRPEKALFEAALAARLEHPTHVSSGRDLSPGEYFSNTKSDSHEWVSYIDTLVELYSQKLSLFMGLTQLISLGGILKRELTFDNNRTFFQIWNAGCLTGEAAVSIALILSKQEIKFRIVASSVSAWAIKQARSGFIPNGKISLSAPQRFLHQPDLLARVVGGYQTTRQLSDNITYAAENPCWVRGIRPSDVIIARNFPISEKYLSNLVKQLEPRGLLVLHPKTSMPVLLTTGNSKGQRYAVEGIVFKKVGPDIYQRI